MTVARYSQPALPAPQVRDVAYQPGAGDLGGEVPPDRVRRVGGLWVGRGGGLVGPWLHRDQAVLAHDVSDRSHRHWDPTFGVQNVCDPSAVGLLELSNTDVTASTNARAGPWSRSPCPRAQPSRITSSETRPVAGTSS